MDKKTEENKTFTQDELKNIQVFLSRMDIKGTESLPHAIIMQKLNLMIEPDVERVKEKKEEPKKEK